MCIIFEYRLAKGGEIHMTSYDLIWLLIQQLLGDSTSNSDEENNQSSQEN